MSLTGTVLLVGLAQDAAAIGIGLFMRSKMKSQPDWRTLQYGGMPNMTMAAAKKEFKELQGQAMPIKIAKALNVAIDHPELLACMPQKMGEDGKPIDDKLLPELYAAARCRQFNNDFLKEGGL